MHQALLTCNRDRFMRLRLLCVTLTLSAACTPHANVGSPSPDQTVSYVTRLGSDTVTVETYRRSGNHLDADIMQRSPMTYVARSSIELSQAGLATTWMFDPRLVSGARPPNAPTRTLTMGTDSTTVVSDTGAQFQRRVRGGPAIPSVTNSMLSWQLAIDYARAQKTDSAPLISTTGTHSWIPILFLDKNTVRSFGGGPIYPITITLDDNGRIVRYDGSRTTNKIISTRATGIEVRTIASAFSVRDQTAGAMGATSPRDTARAQIAGAQLWIDYGRPSLRGRDVWRNGVLGDTLWRTGANAATQFKTDVDLRISGVTIPAGMYTLWTHVLPRNSAYELVFNKQVGQWGAGANVYDPKNDLARVPLTVRQRTNSAERFTMSIEPGGDGGVIAMQWGGTRLETPFTIVRK